MREIIPDRLWVGASADVKSLREFLNADGRAVMQLAHEESGVALPRDLIVCRFPLNDSDGNDRIVIRMAVQCLVTLLKATIPTLVTCGTGMSRSPSIAAAAISLVDSRPLEDCLVDITKTEAVDVSAGFWSDVVAVVGRLNPGDGA